MANSDSEAKWQGLQSRSVPSKRTSISRVADNWWNISQGDACKALNELGAKILGFQGGPCVLKDKTLGTHHCLHQFPGKSLTQCCGCEQTFVDNASELEDEGLI